MTSTSASREEVAEVSATTSSSSSSLPSSFGFVETLDVPVLGSFREGFFDPLTAKLRRIPLELIRVEKASSVPSLSYSLQGENSGGLAFLDLSTKLTQDLEYLTTTTTSSSIMDITGDMLDLEPPRPTRAKSTTSTSSTSKPLFSFNDIPGLVALNHPDKYPNGGSSEFFCLQSADSILEQRRRKSLDGDYAPFGYIVQGWDVFNQLQPNDVISNTVVDEWGVLNLVKIRESRFSDVVASPSSEQEEEEDADTETTTTNNSSVSNES